MSVVVGARCTACGACLSTCPERALLPAARRPVVDGLRCTDCLACVEICPAGAITLEAGSLGPATLEPVP